MIAKIHQRFEATLRVVLSRAKTRAIYVAIRHSRLELRFFFVLEKTKAYGEYLGTQRR